MALIAIFMLSCKESNTLNKGEFNISLEIRILNDDRISVYYIEEEAMEYQEEKSVSLQVNGSPNTQTVMFSLPELPIRFRIDLGEVGFLEEVVIKEIRLNYLGKTVHIDQNVLHRFFKENIYAKSTQNGYKRMYVSGRYDPFIESTALLHQRMNLTFDLYDNRKER